MAVTFAVNTGDIQGLQTLTGNGAGLNSAPAMQVSTPQPSPTLPTVSGP